MMTYERVKIAQSYIESKYKLKKTKEEEKKRQWFQIEEKIKQRNLNTKEVGIVKETLLHEEANELRKERRKLTIFQFESIAIIGKGAFGEVRVCRDKESGEILAVKKMCKKEMHKKNQVLHVRSEQQVLAQSVSPWIVDLKYSFQDDRFLYLVMEFLPGGDLMTLLMEEDILPEDQARLFTAEMVLAIEDVHRLKCIHRDIKPDNVLIGKDGHIKLSDFGLSRKSDYELYSQNPPNDLKNAYSHIPGISDIVSKYAHQFENTKRKKRIVSVFT